MHNGTIYTGSALTDYAKQQGLGGLSQQQALAKEPESGKKFVQFEATKPERCECHECTQARLTMWMQGRG